MSTHTLKAKRRHPDTQRERITVGHITFELSSRDKTFALIAGDAVQAKDRRPLFSGLIEPEMEKELRRVAFRMKTILGDNDEVNKK
tara:strand:+ start:152 stop:409 length:258 start_codon:yes stop_codon:yes gene_type:complete